MISLVKMARKGDARIQSIRRYLSKAMSPRPSYSRGMLGRYARRGMVSNSLAARVHQFKRVAVPVVIKDGGANTIPSVVNAGSGPYYYCQVNNKVTGEVTGTIGFGGALTFMLGQAAQVSEIVSLFDSYRIKKVILRFDYTMNQAPSGLTAAGITTANAYAVPLIHIAPDFDSNEVPGNREVVLANSYTRTYRLDRSFTVSLTPRAQSVITGQSTPDAQNPAPVGGMLSPNTWIDCHSQNVPHFGYKFWVDDFNAVGANSSSLRITPTYILEAKNVV